MTSIVPNLFPTRSSHLRIALVGEAPGAEEVKKGEPFVGSSGRLLAALLSRAGTSREACFIGNIANEQPHCNEISNFDWNGPEIQGGICRLVEDLEKYKPNIVVCLGGTPLHFLKTGNVVPKKASRGGFYVFKWPCPPTSWRGSLFQSHLGYKCISTLHPAYCLPNRCPEDLPLLQFDLKKAVREGTSPSLNLPKRFFVIDSNVNAIIDACAAIEHQKIPIAVDIEGYIGDMSCVSISHDKAHAFIIPFSFKNKQSCFNNSHDEARVWRAFASLMENPNVPKILQNSLYDRFVLHYSYGIRVRGVVDDTMLKWWELYAELEKALSVQASICTDEPYYKGDRKSQDDKTFFEYCCKDSAVTYEINQVLNPRVNGTSLTHYRLNVALLNPLLYMEMRGIWYDVDGAANRRASVRLSLFEHQARLNGLSGRYVKSKKEIWERAHETFYYKKASFDLVGTDQMVRKPEEDNVKRFNTLVAEAPTLAGIGEIEDLLGASLNIDSTKKFASYLYDELGLPPQYDDKKDPPALTTDYEALLKLSKHAEKERPDCVPILRHCIEIRSLDTRQEMLGISADSDGRVRCGYNLVGSDTGRITCYTSPTGSGYNLQTIPKADRDLFLADDGCWLFQCDLSGADGWTVAAYSAMLGDSTMLDDYRFGLKPAKILVLALRASNVNFNDREALKVECKKVSSDDWDYFGMKRVQHGASYCEGPRRISNQVMTDSEGKFFISETECKALRDKFFFKRYPGIQRWHNWVDNKVRERPTLIAASGQVRHFFGHKDKLLPKAVAFEPQANTTYATNLAMFKLWTDPDNRHVERWDSFHGNLPVPPNPSSHPESREDKKIYLRIEPLHQVHDALIGQFKKTDTSWAVGKINEWFDNPLYIAGQKIVIPFEGGYGKSWAQAGDEEKREGKI